MRSLNAVAAVFAVTLLALAPTAWAAEQAIPFHGQNSAIFVEGDPLIHWIGEPTDMDLELVLVYTNPEAVNKLRTTLQVDARVLVVGGGGEVKR